MRVRSFENVDYRSPVRLVWTVATAKRVPQREASGSLESGEATMCYLPGIETPERECWYINMGAVDKAFLTEQLSPDLG